MTSPSALHTPGWRTWTVWIVGVAAYVVAITNRTSLSSVGVDAAIRFDAAASALSMFAVIQLAVYGSLQVPVGLILARLGARPVIAAGMVLMATGQLVMAFADAVGIGILARVLIGAGDAAVFPGAEELCNSVDDDCSGSVWPATAQGRATRRTAAGQVAAEPCSSAATRPSGADARSSRDYAWW